MGRIFTAIIIEQDPDARAAIRDAYDELGTVEILAETDSLIYGYELIRKNRPDMAFIDLREDQSKSLEIMNRVSTYFKEIMIVTSGEKVDMKTVMECMQAGAREFLERPFTLESLEELVIKHRRTLSVDLTGDTSGRILTVFSNKGGLGKTTIAVNTALALSEITEKPVALIDLNLQLGDITTFLDVLPKQTIVDIAKNIGRVDAAYLETSLANFRYDKSNLYILADPLHVEEGEEVTADQINTVLTVLKATFEYVVIDTTTSFDSKTLTALDLADNILLISMVNLPCIRSSQRVLTLFERLGYDKDKVKLVINRYVSGEEISIDDVEQTLDHDVFWKIPNNYFSVMTAINRGVPINSLDNGQAIYQNFIDFSRQLTGLIHGGGSPEKNTPTKGEKKSLFSMFGK